MLYFYFLRSYHTPPLFPPYICMCIRICEYVCVCRCEMGMFVRCLCCRSPLRRGVVALAPFSVSPKPDALESSITRMRNIGVVAHIDAGKTTTTERMLFYAGAVSRLGEVDSGTTTTDFMQEEMDRGITIQSAAVSLRWREHDVHLIDTPGHVDFTVEVERAMRVVDGVVALFDAAVGVQAQSYTVLQQSRKFGVPAIAFLNKMDKFNADMPRAVASIRAKLGVEPLLLQLPLTAADGGFEGVVDLTEMASHRFGGSHGAQVEVRPVSEEAPHVQTAALAARHALFATLTAVDDALAEEVIAALDAANGEETAAEALVSAKALRAAVRRQTLLQCRQCPSQQDDPTSLTCESSIQDDDTSPNPALQDSDEIHNTSCSTNSSGSSSSNSSGRAFMPVLCGASRRDQGVQPLLDAVTMYLPSPLDRALTWRTRDGCEVPLPAPTTNPNAAVVALAFKVMHAMGPKGRRQPLVFVRVYSGRLAPRMTLRNNSNGQHESVERLYVMRANEPVEVPHLVAGEIGAAFLQHTRTGDTLFRPALSHSRRHAYETPSTQTNPMDMEGLTLEGISPPLPVISFAVEAATRHQIPLLEEALSELTCEDPSLSVCRNDLGQLVLSGMGELHLEIALSRLEREYHLQCRLLRAVIAYRETVTTAVSLPRAIGANGDTPYLECALRLDPLIDADGMCSPNTECAFAIDTAFAAAYRREFGAGGRRGGRADEMRAAEDELRLVSDVFTRAVSECVCLGPLAGLPMHAVRITLGGMRRLSAGPCTERALAPAARAVVLQLLREAPRSARAALEPMMEAEVHLSDAAFVGGVVSSLNERNATTVDILEDGKSVRAVVPMRNIVRYTMELRRAVKGHASLYTRLHHYRVVEDKAVLARIMKNLGIYENA